MKKVILIQFIVLLIGTIFAWFNFFQEITSWLTTGTCGACSFGVNNPFLAPCFYGAIFFTIALVLNIILINQENH